MRPRIPRRESRPGYAENIRPENRGRGECRVPVSTRSLAWEKTKPHE
jgi:hypothetical protein